MNDNPTVTPVSLLRRLAAIVYDALLLFAVLFIAMALITNPFKVDTGQPLEVITIDNPLYWLRLLYIFLISYVFLGWFWTHSGQTLGMKTWHIKVVQGNGDAVNWKQAFIRLSVAWCTLGLTLLWCLFNQDRLALHDRLSGTRLIKTNNKLT